MTSHDQTRLIAAKVCRWSGNMHLDLEAGSLFTQGTQG